MESPCQLQNQGRDKGNLKCTIAVILVKIKGLFHNFNIKQIIINKFASQAKYQITYTKNYLKQCKQPNNLEQTTVEPSILNNCTAEKAKHIS